MLISLSVSVTFLCKKRMFMFEVLFECLCSFDQWVLKFACVSVFLSLLKMAESTRPKLFQEIREAYTDAYKEKNGKDVELGVSVKREKIKKMKDLDLEIAVNKRISELKKPSMKKEV